MSDQTASEPVPCSPCRGTGEVISNLGGEPSTQPCPWCEGSGVFIPEHDSQHRFKDAETGAPDSESATS